ncbi:MAG: peptidoglycan editing factor PgeF [Candidatus Omnitrophica bacterium]|nr:peptidoglycan editing factor PgeF [Candidatus Omnitrophota bacterium]
MHVQAQKSNVWLPLGVCQDLVCAQSSRYYGNMSLSYGQTQHSVRNREQFLHELGIDHEQLVCLKQVHGSSIQHATGAMRGRGALHYDTALDSTDGLITNESSVPLVVLTADCLSVFIYDRKTPAIGLVHAGWRSSRECIVKKAIALMQERFATDVKMLLVAFGTCLQQCCYEVKTEFLDFFPKQVTKRNQSYFFDLAAVNKFQLQEAGVPVENIIDSGSCTGCLSEDCFSFRKEGSSCGRMMSVMMLR